MEADREKKRGLICEMVTTTTTNHDDDCIHLDNLNLELNSFLVTNRG